MGSASNGKLSIGRKRQADKDTHNFTEMVTFPFQYQSGYGVTPEVDDFNDLVENQFESSKTQILGAYVNGGFSAPANADLLALLLSSVLGNVTSLLVGTPQTFTVNASTDVFSVTNHGFINGQKVRLSNSGGALPAGTAALTNYFVGNRTGDTFKLYPTIADASLGTNAVNATDTGTGTNSVTPQIFTHTIIPNSAANPNFHSVLFNDGTCDRRIIGQVFNSVGFGCGYDNKRMNVQTQATAIRRESNDLALTGTFTVNASTDVFTSADHNLSPGDAVQLTTTDTLPAGTSLATTYFSGTITDDTFKLYPSWLESLNEVNAINATNTGTGTHTFTTLQVAYPTQEVINPIHFTNTGSVLDISIDGGTATSYASNWAGFSYGLEDLVDAEQRSGSNSLRVIERQDRKQSMMIMMDYLDSTFKNLIDRYQREVEPPKLSISMKLRGKQIGNGHYFEIQGTFYNCNISNHSYNTDPSIGKQTLDISVNHDIQAGKSVQWVIKNDVPGYLT